MRNLGYIYQNNSQRLQCFVETAWGKYQKVQPQEIGKINK